MTAPEKDMDVLVASLKQNSRHHQDSDYVSASLEREAADAITELSARLSQAETELRKCQDTLLDTCGLAADLRERAEKAEQAAEEMRANDERWRYLKTHHLQTGPDSWIRTGDDLEEAVDAAIKAGKEGT